MGWDLHRRSCLFYFSIKPRSRGSYLTEALLCCVNRLIEGKSPTDIVIDSTGLKIYGEGECKVRVHGKQKRRTWRKYHVAINPDSHEVTAIELTVAHRHDSKVISDLLSNQKNLGKVYADGAYPFKHCMDAIAEAGDTRMMPVRSGTCLVKTNPSKGEELRNQLIADIRKAEGKVMWKKTSGYHKRSLVETHMFRLKTILGASLRGRKFENQRTEARIMAKILNRMTRLGMPESEAIV